MADIRRTVGLLDGGRSSTTPEPGVDDITGLIADFTRAGIEIDYRLDGKLPGIPPTVGLALYRITQESLANVLKHASASKAAVAHDISDGCATLSIVNELPRPPVSPDGNGGWALDGMRQRAELLGGSVWAGPDGRQWRVHSNIPLSTYRRDSHVSVIRG
jgi:signal transduction histidine kinase